MAVWQSRAFFEARDGFIVDNPKVGPTLAAEMWAPGNSETFLDLVTAMTGEALTGAAWVRELSEPVEAVVASERAAYEAAAASLEKCSPEEEEGGEEKVDLAMRVRLVDGDAVIADTAEDGGFLKACSKFEEYIQGRFLK